MTRIIIDRHRVSLEYATDCIIVRTPGQTPRSLPLNRIEQLICMHNVQLTTQLIGQLYRRGIDLIVLNQRHEKNSFALFADQQLQVERRCRQYAWQLDEPGRLAVAIDLCRHKFNVLERVLKPVSGTERTRRQIRLCQEQLAGCRSEQQLRGIEGSLQRQAFEHWRSLVPVSLGFTRRQRRPPKDPVNATLSLSYTLVHQDAVRQARKHALDPQLGFYHRTAYGRQSLACDLMEPVRPLIESWVSRLFADAVLSGRHFSTSEGRCLLGKTGRQLFYAEFDDQSSGWRRHLEAAARWVARRIDNLPEDAA